MGPIGGGGYTVDRGAPMYRGYLLSRAASHSLAKILDSRIERVGGIDRSPRAGDLELIRIAAHDRAAIDEAVERERKAAPGAGHAEGDVRLSAMVDAPASQFPSNAVVDSAIDEELRAALPAPAEASWR